MMECDKMASDTQKIIGWILVVFGFISFIIGVSMPDDPHTAVNRWGDSVATYENAEEIRCEDGEMTWGYIDDGVDDCQDGSDERKTAGAEFGAACCFLLPIGLLVALTGGQRNQRQITIIQNPAQMQMQAQQQQMQMQAQQQQMQMQAQQQRQMQMQAQQQQMRQNIGSVVQNVGTKISGGGERDKFKEILSMVLADGNMSKQEEDSIEKKRVELNISMEEHRKILDELGLDYDKLKQLQRAKLYEDSGKLDAAAQLYEEVGKLDKASALRFQMKAMEKSSTGPTTYNISDSAIGGGINERNE